MSPRPTPDDAKAPVPPHEAEALKTGRPPPRSADDGKTGGQSQGGRRGAPNDPGAGNEHAVPGDARGGKGDVPPAHGSRATPR